MPKWGNYDKVEPVHYEIGERVELLRCNDPYAKLYKGLRGNIVFIDDLGTVSVKWDNGCTLGMIPFEDVFIKV